MRILNYSPSIINYSPSFLNRINHSQIRVVAIALASLALLVIWYLKNRYHGIKINWLFNRHHGDNDVERWSKYNEKLHQTPMGKELKPYAPVDTLVKNYLNRIHSSNPVLDIGCELGKNAACLIAAGHRVHLLDIAPNAIQYTQANLKKMGLHHGVHESTIGRIETLDVKYGPYIAVVGTYVFSFIVPNKFNEVMKNILSRIEKDGFFAGGFFGPDHPWANDPEKTILTRAQVEEFFKSMDFNILEINEKRQKHATMSQGVKTFHTIEIIAQRKRVPEKFQV